MNKNLENGKVLLVAAVIVHDVERGRVLLLQRGPKAKFAPGMWDLPVGKNESGEPVSETAVRELKEETGLVVSPDSLELAGVIHCAQGVEAPNGFLTVVFVSKQWSGEPVNVEPAKHAQVSWIGTDSIPVEFVPTTAEALKGYLVRGSHVCLYGW